MARESLQAPWRMDYIRDLSTSGSNTQSLQQPPKDCFLCQAVKASSDQERRERLVLWHSDQIIVVINKFPYTNGHLLVAPLGHVADLDLLDEPTLLQLQQATVRCMRLLRRAMSPQGFNIGINLGRCAGAGLPGHLHQHVVPRWSGDTNFMSVVGDVRVVPQAMNQLFDELRSALADL